MIEDNCVFCKIIDGKASAYKVYEDREVLAFLDVNPISEGHTLVIPKRHFENIYDIEDGLLQQVTVVAKRLAIEYKERLGAKAINLAHASGAEAEQSVFHFHVHVIPRYPGKSKPIAFRYSPRLKKKLAETFRKIKQT